ncbi:MAG: LysR family transcriptional regulator [Novosphingobium sp.]
MLPRFTTRQLSAFVAAAEAGSFTVAAGRLNLTPSAVSSLISELEHAVGFSLFERTTRKVALTPQGRQFLPVVLSVQRRITMTAVAASDIANRSVDVVRVAAPQAVAATLLPPLIAAYRVIEPRTEVRVVDTGVEWMADRLLSGEADLALGPDRTVSSDVSAEHLYETAWVVWFSPAHALAGRSDVRWADLQGIDFFTAGRDHEQSVGPFGGHGPNHLAIAPQQVFDNISTALGMAAAGLGITFSPEYVKALALPMGLVMRPVIEPHITRYVTLYASADRELPDKVTALRNFIRERLKGKAP